MAPLLVLHVYLLALAAQLVPAHILLSSGGQPASHTLDICGRGHLEEGVFAPLETCPVPADETSLPDASSWAPWTHAPYCTDNRYCVYTDARFRNNLGISIVTTPENIANVSSLWSLLSMMPKSREPVPPSYVIKPIPDKGIGVVATRNIRRGEIIMTEPVAVLADFDIPKKLPHSDGVLLFNRAFNQLPDPDQAWTLAKSSEHLLAPAAEDVMRTNSFGVALNNFDRMAIFPNISRINHGCEPNTATRWTAELLEMAVVAVRDIESGEELTHTYSLPGLTRAERQKQLQTRWGFQCSCSLCTASAKEISNSDERRKKIKELSGQVQTLIGQEKFIRAIDAQNEVISLVEKEKLYPKLWENYWTLAELYSDVGDWGSTRRYAKKAYAELKDYAKGGTEMAADIAQVEMYMRML